MRQALGNGTSRRLRRGLGMLGAAALFTLSGCWLQPGGGAGGTRHNDHETRLTAATVTAMAESWSVLVGQRTMSEPIVDEAGRVITAWHDPLTDAMEIDARSSTTGEPLWALPLPTGTGAGENWVGQPSVPGPSSSVAVPYGVASQPCSSSVGRFSTETGAPVAHLGTGVSGTITTPVIGGDGIEAFVTAPCGADAPTWRLRVNHGEHGRFVWGAELPGPVSTPTIAGGRLFVTAAGRLYAYPAGGCGTADCPPEWTYTAPAGAVYGRPAVTPGGHVAVSAYDQAGPPERPFSRSMVQVVAADTGTGRWSTLLEAPDSESSQQGFAVDGATLFVVGTPSVFAGRQDRLAAYPLAGCGAAVCPPAWTAPLDDAPGVAGPVVGGGVVYVDGTDRARAFPATGCGAATCSELHSVPLGARARAFALADGRLFVSFWSSSATFPSLTAYGL